MPLEQSAKWEMNGIDLHTCDFIGNWTLFLEQLLCSVDCVGELKAEVVCSIPAKKMTKPGYYHR